MRSIFQASDGIIYPGTQRMPVRLNLNAPKALNQVLHPAPKGIIIRHRALCTNEKLYNVINKWYSIFV